MVVTMKSEKKYVRIEGATMSKLKPVGARVVIKVESVNTLSKGGLIIPEAVAESQRPARGVVVEVCKECEFIEKGDYVVFMMYAGAFIEDADEQAHEQAQREKVIYRIVRESEVFGVWKRGDWKYVEESDDGDE